MILDYFTVLRNDEIAGGIFRTVFEYGGEMPEIKPGQFLNIYPKNPALSLPRPISVCDSQNGRITVVFKVVGKGTEEFSEYKPGERVKLMLPLGKGYDLPSDGCNTVVIGGGIGVPPMLFAAKALKARGCSVTAFLGFEKEPVLLDEIAKTTDKLFVSTDTGSYGEKGNVVGLLNKHDEKKGFYFGCGPVPMLKSVCRYLKDNGLDGQISLEERMACGFGVCVGCAVKINTETGWQYMKVCKDGPVFDYKEVLWD